jgi:hypothetical protein
LVPAKRRCGADRNQAQTSSKAKRINLCVNFYPGDIDRIILSGYIHPMTAATTCTAFHGNLRFASGTLPQVAAAIRDVAPGSVLVFDDTTGRVIDIDPRISHQDLAPPTAHETRTEDAPSEETRGRGRPKLGVVPREVTLLPRHWDWLNSQPGGASVVLRRLVEDARRASGDKDRVRQAQEAANRFLTAMGGDLPNFEEATRALFAYDRRRFAELLAAWPEDLRDHAIRLAFADLTPQER